jgi:hypothetical protein
MQERKLLMLRRITGPGVHPGLGGGLGGGIRSGTEGFARRLRESEEEGCQGTDGGGRFERRPTPGGVGRKG